MIKLVLDIRRNLKELVLIIILPLVLTLGYVFFTIPDKPSLLQAGRLKTIDFFLNNRYRHSPVPDIAKQIVIINIDEDTFVKLKEQWPLNRGFTAYLLEKLSKPETQPKILGIGLIFTGKSDSLESDQWLAATFKKYGNAVLADYFNPDGELILPEYDIAVSVKAMGFINTPVDSDQVIRRSNTFIYLKDKTISHSFALEIFAHLEGYNLGRSYYDPVTQVLKISTNKGKIFTVPADPKTWATRINYLARPEDFKSVALWEALTALVPPSTFKDKIILVGTNMEITKDIYLTPLGEMPSMYIHANFLMDLLLNRFLKELPLKLNIAILLVFSMIVALVRSRLRIIKSTLLLVVIILTSYYFTNNYFAKDILIDFFGISLLSLLSFLIVSIVEYTSVVLENVNLKKLAITDGLTGLYIYRYFEVKLAKEINLALQQNKELSLVIFDIDNFKKCNDTYGHEAGNEVLQNVSGILRNRCRQTDTICRFGGEEFVSILGITDMERAGKYAEAIRKSVEVLDVNWNGEKIKVTISAGVSSLSSLENKTSTELIESADKALYVAKNSGRNKVALASQL